MSHGELTIIRSRRLIKNIFWYTSNNINSIQSHGLGYARRNSEILVEKKRYITAELVLLGPQPSNNERRDY